LPRGTSFVPAPGKGSGGIFTRVSALASRAIVPYASRGTVRTLALVAVAALRSSWSIGAASVVFSSRFGDMFATAKPVLGSAETR